MFWKKSSIKDLLPPPVRVAHGEYSMILSAHDDVSQPTESLLSISMQAIQEAMKVDLTSLSPRLNGSLFYPDIWPGEHYKLLAGLVLALKAKRVIEIGTSTGLSALCLREALGGGRLDTFDIVSWKSYPNTVLREGDFQKGLFEQHVEDLSVNFEPYRELLSQADLIFIDATHDGKLEKKLLDLIQSVKFDKTVYLLFDDIRVWTMLKMWREISLPKIDLTSFGHWSGTGVVQLSAPR